MTSKQIEPRISFSSRSIHSVFSCPGLVMATCRHLQRMSLPISPTLSTLLCVFIVQSLYWSLPICEVDNFLASKSGIKGKPLFEMCWFYMGIAQIALDPPLSVKQANMELKCPKPSWQVLTPPGNVGKSAPNHPGKPLHPQATWEKSDPNHPGNHPPPLTGNAHLETTHFKKGLPLNQIKSKFELIYSLSESKSKPWSSQGVC